MSYVFAQTYKGPVARHGHRSIEVDVAVTGTELAGVGGSVDVDVSADAPYNGSSYESPLSVEIVRRVSPTAADHDVAVIWDYGSDNTTNGTLNIKVTNGDAVTANGLANLAFRVIAHYRTLKSGGVS